MGKKNRQQRQKSKSNWIPPVGNGGIQKKHSCQPLSIAPVGHTQNNQVQLPGFPIFPFPARLSPGNCNPSVPPPSLPHPSLLPPNVPFPPNPFTATAHPHFLPPPSFPPSFPPPFPAPSVSLRPPGLITAPVLSSTGRKQGSMVAVSVQGNRKRVIGEKGAKKAQLKYVKDLAAKANKRASMGAKQEVKTASSESRFNVFKTIAQRYRSVQKSPEPIDIPEDTEEEGEDDVEEIPREQEEKGAASNITILEDMSICTVDEVGEQTMAAVDEEEDEEEETEEREEEGEIEVVSEEEGDDEIVCLGTQKTKHVLSVVTLGDEDEEVEVEEVDVMNKAFTRREEGDPPMEDSIIDLSLDDEESSEIEKVTSGSELPDFIPLIDGNKKTNKKDTGKHQQINGLAQSVQQSNGGMEKTASPSPSMLPWKNTQMVMMSRTKSTRERKREMYRKRAENRAMSLEESPSTVAASICSFPPFTPSKIPLPQVPAPPTPLAHLLTFPPGSIPSSSAMGLIQSRSISTSAPQSQPVNVRNYGMSHLPSSSLSSGVDSAPTLAAVLNDERTGIVRDALTANRIFPRQWEEKWMTQAPDSSSPDVKVDPSAAPFRICSYNVLCQKTISATTYLYRHTRFQPHVLEWSHRWPLIQKDLSELNADVFGLQEIQDIHFEQFYEPFMKSLGYSCFFQRKSETSHSDGLGLFVRTNRFKITAMKTVDFLIPGDTLLNRGNVAQLFRVECLQTGASLIVTNTHILFNERRGDVKLAQIALLMANIHAMRQDDEPVVCLGDWNLEPESDLYHYITNGSLDASRFVPRYGSGQLREGRNFNVAPMREMPMDTHLKTRMSRDGIIYQNEGSLLQSLQRSSRSMFSHQIPLTSTYAPYRERHVSTFHKDIANPDFIFYSTTGTGEGESRRLRLIRRLAVPPETSILRMEPWPNHFVPSDHIPLLAEFYLSK
ncbi:hypothetical protein PMAYCL1PPCAC_29107 [Pristionchus mayeri]|uniref:Endonuclease/exonuclease/phosphatase domain-containing protein n=1 Tax=Pristionchus mayeri TaxID=1317129 RepID=A0AAN5DB22_9BILA|nr:hypothetical protein PMAYCL1PPCAC_29107 [Pristionchus mayeri]